MEAKTGIIFFTILFMLLQISCGGDFSGSKTDKNSTADSDQPDIPDVNVNSEGDPVDLPGATDNDTPDDPAPQNNDNDSEKEMELDESFIAENQGFRLLLEGKVIPYPGNNPIKPENQLKKLIAELDFGEEGAIHFTNIKRASVFREGSANLYISLTTELESSSYYSLNASLSQSKLATLKQNGENISDDSIFNGFSANKISYIDNNQRVVACPVAMVEQSDANKLYFSTENTSWQEGDPVGIMMNISVVTGKKNLAALTGTQFHELCTCYKNENGGYNTTKCEAKDFYEAPSIPELISPADRSISESGDVELSFEPSIDPEGLAVKYDIYFGETPYELEKAAEDIETTEYTLSTSADKNYFWKVVAKSESGHEVESVIFAFSTKNENPFSDILVVVNENIEEATRDAVATYRNDLEKKNLRSDIFRFPAEATVDDLKEELKNRYDAHFIQGAFLIGDIPAAWYELDNHVSFSDGSKIVLKERFPTDLYVMDFEAQWEDTIDNGTEEDKTVKQEPNGIYDKHSPLHIRIFTARLLGNADDVNKYLAKLHKYNTEGSFLDKSLLLYIDDDWANEGSGNDTWYLDPIYLIDSIWKKEETTMDRYKIEIVEGHEFVYQWIHSGPHALYFNQNFGDEIVTIDELETIGVKGSFYNLFDCSASRFNDPEYERDGKPVSLADMYLKTDYGIATIGSSKVGGMYNPEHFHGNLTKGKSWGESYRIWYNKSGTADDTWWLGMTIFGDPTTTLNKKTRRSINSTSGFSFTPDQIMEMKWKMIMRQKALRKNKL